MSGGLHDQFVMKTNDLCSSLGDDLPAWFQDVLGVRPFVWQGIVRLVPKSSGAVRMARAASSSGELGIWSAKLAAVLACFQVCQGAPETVRSGSAS